MTTPREKLKRRRETFTEYVDGGEIDPETGAAIEELLDAYDDHNIMVPTPGGEGPREPGTLMAWCYRLMQFARARNLTTATAADLKEDIQAMHSGDHPTVQDSGIKKSTLRTYQAALRKFYGYHEEYGVVPEDIPMFSQEESHVDPSDMLTKAEIQEAREAAGNPRDRLIFELLLYTGQRREAIRTLRLKDVNLQEGTYRLNPEVDGLKGAQDRNGNRPLLGAKAAVQNWLDYHPDTGDPENYLITARPSYSVPDPTEPVSGETIRRVMEDIKADTSIDKPMHPHAIRHNFVTIADRDYDLPHDTIKYLIGHDAASQVMETTYSHLSGDDHVERAEEAFGIREPEDDSPLTPEVCPTCGHNLEPAAKACARCGAVFTPDAEGPTDPETAVKKSKLEADDLETLEKVEMLEDLLEDDDVRALLDD